MKVTIIFEADHINMHRCMKMLRLAVIALSIQRHVTRRIKEIQLLTPTLCSTCSSSSPSRVRVVLLQVHVQCSTVCTRTASCACTVFTVV